MFITKTDGTMTLSRIFTPEFLPVATRAPRTASDVPSWQGHIPFAFWLIGTLKPSLLVELGTHKGDSYNAFCQRIDELKLPTRAYAVDTWQGDEHAGHYENSVYDGLSAYHLPLYGHFSRLVRATFDEAREQFGENSIDLLHIDGLHTYEAVKHDYESWLPALKEKGVILFHDINVRERGFGVWQLWAELTLPAPEGQGIPHFSFLHSHGLGVLFPKGVPESLAFLPALNAEERNNVRETFSRLGDAIITATENRRLKAETARTFADIEREREEFSRAIAAKDTAYHELEGYARSLKAELESIKASTAWRMTEPVRKVAGMRGTKEE
jgi:hypothetical protein